MHKIEIQILIFRNTLSNSNDIQHLEKLARERYRMVKPGEKVYKVIPEKKDDHIFICNLISQFKDERMKKVFELRYFSGSKKMTWVNIGSKLKVSAQTAINLHNKGKDMIRKKFDSDLVIADKIL